MADTTGRYRYGALAAVLGAGAVVAASDAGQFDGPLSYVVVAVGAILGIGALAGIYHLRHA